MPKYAMEVLQAVAIAEHDKVVATAAAADTALASAVAQIREATERAEAAERKLDRLSAADWLTVKVAVEGGEAAVVTLPCSAVLLLLKQTAHQMGAPPPAQQVLTCGGRGLGEDATRLSRTLVGRASQGDWPVVVARRVTGVFDLSVGCSHAVVLDGGSVAVWGRTEGTADADGATSVHAGGGFTAAVVGGKVKVWGKRAAKVRDDKLSRRQVVSCSAFGHGLAAVTSDGWLLQCGEAKDAGEFPHELQGTVAAVGCGYKFVVTLTFSGAVYVVSSGKCEEEQLGGAKVKSVSAGTDHYALVMEDGSVRCGGRNGSGQCSVPGDLTDVDYCSCGVYFTVALRRDGTLRCWGRAPEGYEDLPKDTFTAVAAGQRSIVARRRGGPLVAIGDAKNGEGGLYRPPGPTSVC
eukprot:TRINITY_DN40013_c0_g1_i1.p1 TRINITY_DN40013_c0_g1~~TRINITY_DN40013_c0_g1_i1.p1  ORF type:complete len:427 (+),score=106.26 TRINITY_DN40013_c0_g1_i1:62-1282(+)